MACGGLKVLEGTLSPELSSRSSTYRTLQVALEMMKYINDNTYKAGKKLHLKIGIHYGPCVFGVLGYHKPQFSLIGDTVNTTSRHCTGAEKDQIAISESAYMQIRDLGLVHAKVETDRLTLRKH
jgi:class 3 adenylate cyclase